MALVEEFPISRNGAVMFVYDHQLLVWGGMTQVVLGEGEDRFNIDIILPGQGIETCLLWEGYVSPKY